MNEKIKVLNIEKNPVHTLLFYSTRKVFFYNNYILNKFRFNYYCLKFKRQFRSLLWEKIRKSKIEAYYHPNNLNILLMNLNYSDDDEEFNKMIEEW